jgi:two-component system sensor histidine kinase/response regulator
MLGPRMRLLTLSLFFWLAALAAPALAFNEYGHAQASDTSRANLLNRLSTSLRETDHDTALRYAEEAFSIANDLDYPKGKAVALENMGWVFYRKADYVKALQLSIESMKIAEQLGDKAQMARAMNSIASVSFEQKQTTKAISEFKRALALGVESGEAKVIGRTLNNLAYLYLSANNQVDSAEFYVRKAIGYTERIKDSYLTAFGLRTLGDIMIHRGDYNEAMATYQKSFQLSEASLNNSMKAATIHRIAKAHLLMGEKVQAIALLKQNAEEAKRLGYLEELERTYKLLAEIYQSEGNAKEAYVYLNEYTMLHDTIFSKQSGRQIALLQNQFDLDMKQAQIELLTKEADLKQEEITSQRMQLYAMILGASCVLLLVVVILGAYQKVKRANKELQLQKQELAQKNLEINEKSLELSSLVNTKDKLFSIIGHDFRSPLHSLKGMLDLLTTKTVTPQEFERFSGELKKKIDTVYNNLDNMLNWSVSQLHGIKAQPVPVNPGMLVSEVFDLHSEIARVKKVFLSNDIDESMEVFADKDQIRLVIRNLVSNALKFTPTGGFIRVWGRSKGKRATIFVQDSGVGIKPSDMGRLFVKETLWSATGTNNEKGLGLGLLLCKEFIEENQGELEVKSEPGVGSTVSFSLPLAEGFATHAYFERRLSEN